MGAARSSQSSVEERRWRSAFDLPNLSESDLVELLERASSVPEEERDGFGERADALLAMTASRSVRNAAAIAIADLGRFESRSTLNRLLARPELAQEGGSLLFALDELRAPVALDALLNVIERGSYEARAEALILMEEGLVEPFDDERRSAALASLSRIAASADEEAAEAASIALDRLPDRV